MLSLAWVVQILSRQALIDVGDAYITCIWDHMSIQNVVNISCICGGRNLMSCSINQYPADQYHLPPEKNNTIDIDIGMRFIKDCRIYFVLTVPLL